MASGEGELEEQNGLIYGLNCRGEQGFFENGCRWSADEVENNARF
jgi:hypothetical protein